MVTVGVTVQLEAVMPEQAPPLHSNDVAAGVQLAVSVDDAPEETMAGVAVNVQSGGAAFAL